MRVVFVGGAGAMGRAVVTAAAGFAEVSQLLVLDRDADRAEAVAEAAGPKAKAVPFDAGQDDLAGLLAGADAVVSTLGPFTVFGRSTIEAAVRAGCHYIDINDDWEPTLDVLSLDARARQAGVTALIGMGASPGVSNVLAMRAAAELDVVHELVTGWALAGAKAEPGGARPSAALLHLVQQATGSIQVVEDGEEKLVRPLRPMTLDYPGLGEIRVRTVGHPEAVTLPRAMPGLSRCVNVMSGPEWYFDHLAGLMARVEAGELSAHGAAVVLEDEVCRPADAPATLRTPTLWAWAKGLRDGQPCRVGAGLGKWPAGRMAGATGLPAAAALRMVLRGEITRRGVVTPEEVVPFDLLMERLAPWYVLPEAAGELYTVAVEKG
ncbi:saccharopine dehydrogenase family protein [Amycolatopsis sp. WGS_07]|uniref:saccharopine dehydrogenase family protein n=1 Tax=Amycolatopsis sp. WGS_07 TaxID=3076764 RepID=UPI0038734191